VLGKGKPEISRGEAAAKATKKPKAAAPKTRKKKA
jgi:hypothetical protein